MRLLIGNSSSGQADLLSPALIRAAHTHLSRSSFRSPCAVPYTVAFIQALDSKRRLRYKLQPQVTGHPQSIHKLRSQGIQSQVAVERRPATAFSRKESTCCGRKASSHKLRIPKPRLSFVCKLPVRRFTLSARPQLALAKQTTRQLATSQLNHQAAKPLAI